MIFPYDSNSRFSDPKADRPTQRPASNSNARKRAGEPGFSPVDGAFGQQLAGLDGCGSIPQATSTERGSVEDPRLDNGFAEVIRKAKAEAWSEGLRLGLCRRLDAGAWREPLPECVVTGAAYLFLSIGAITIYGLAEKAERLRAERNAALRALTKLRNERLGEAETPCPDELALSRAAHPTHTDTESE